VAPLTCHVEQHQDCMTRAELLLEPRGARLFDTWRWAGQIEVAALSPLVVQFQVALNEEPSDEMVAVANQLLEYARANDDYLLDLIHAHYRYAEEEGWLDFWQVPSGISRGEVLSFVNLVALVVDSDLVASVFVDPQWDQEHKLDMLFEGAITRIDGQPFRLNDGVLSYA
jgi:hypothetical protein